MKKNVRMENSCNYLIQFCLRLAHHFFGIPVILYFGSLPQMNGAKLVVQIRKDSSYLIMVQRQRKGWSYFPRMNACNTWLPHALGTWTGTLILHPNFSHSSMWLEYLWRVQVYSYVLRTASWWKRQGAQSYEIVLRTLMTECHSRDMYPDAVTINMEFEMSVILAAKSVIGDHIRIRG